MSKVPAVEIAQFLVCVAEAVLAFTHECVHFKRLQYNRLADDYPISRELADGLSGENFAECGVRCEQIF